ncbi:MAG TPA: DUF4214 domain-containing protein [Pyrinomonadaceae bacterium]|nr:DUF4214 domain-containing protein [Pyrinomonadaceae bacterium]
MRLIATLFLLACLILVPIAPARAYTLQFNNAATIQFKWPTTTITVALSSSLSSPPANIKAGSDVVGAARRALQRWAEAGNIQFNITNSTNEAVGQDGVSLITVAQVNAGIFSNPDQGGRARIFFDPNTGAIFEGDVAANPASQFSTDGTSGTYDLETTFVHEIGHMLGLEHSGIVGAIMQPRQGRNGTYGLPGIRRRTLSDDDRAGLRAIYGPLTGLGEITGVVNNPGGAVFGAHVWAEEVSTGRAFAGNITLPNGFYSIRALPPGQYRIVVEFLNEPVAAAEIATRSGAYQGLQTQVPFYRVFEAGTVNVNENVVTPFDIRLPDTQQAFLNPRYIGINSQLSTVAAPILPGSTTTVFVGGENVHTVSASNITVTSPYFTVDPTSVQQFVFNGPTGQVQVLSFNVRVSVAVAPGDYSLRLVSDRGEVAYVTGGLTIALPNGTTGSNTNLIDDSQFFVAQHYRDFLNREADASGLAFWTNQIEACGADAACREIKRINVSAAFFLSGEFQNTGYLVYRFHEAAFNTGERLRFRVFLPDTQRVARGVIVGVGNWEQQLEANKQAFANEFVSRPEFLAAYPLTMSPEQFVDTLNANTGGSLSQSERDALVNDLRSGARNRAQVLRAVAEDPDFSARESNRAFVLMEYFGYLRRNPDDTPNTDFSGYNFWLGKLNQFNGNFINAEMVKAFITSPEYRQRFGPF